MKPGPLVFTFNTCNMAPSLSMTKNFKQTVLFLHKIHPVSSSSDPHSCFPSSSIQFLPLKPSNISLSTNSRSQNMIIPSVSGIWDALTGGKNDKASAAVMAVKRGMFLFTQGDVLGSLEQFDTAIELDPRQKPRLWQRGLSLYYVDRFQEGAEQFRLDVSLNPNDTEESIWCFLCEAQLYGADEARNRFLEVGQDPRPVMRKAYELFKLGGDAKKLVAAFSSRPDEYFYASLYAGLYYESQKQQNEAKFHLTAAAKSPYAQRSGDYMADLAKVHCLCRKWSTG